jgi:hypothetical protein
MAEAEEVGAWQSSRIDSAEVPGPVPRTTQFHRYGR